MARDTRLQKFLSEAGVASRRKSEEYIAAGRVTVNGRKAQVGDKIDVRKDMVAVDGKNVEFDRGRQSVYIMLYKPRGYVTTMEDEQGRKCVAELVEDVGVRVYPVGRLDMNSEGLLLLTNDGEFANMMMHPRHSVAKSYRVTVRPDLSDAQAAQLAEGVVIDGKKTLPAQVRVVTKEPGRVVIVITIREGRNRQIRKMCEAVGLEVARLKRISVGPLKLGMLRPGKWRHLQLNEIIMLRNAASGARPVPVRRQGKHD
ncbi:pseudouridine synthase [Zongyangia hominis]|uniref:Pseudouridine synthase n=1 Tax=Zongyangia hominis TaxID=2763677 RepID=A0A926EBU5_9FIRM|nr:pseudouridine synthase [Zongyangia hominis]MBC8570928.1 rRNA pseudouridine synthase [Zongyangia hominis]